MAGGMGDNKVAGVFCGTAGSLVRIIIGCAIAVASIAIGATHLNDCPAEKHIPIYLIVSGSVGIALSIVSMIHQKTKRNSDDNSCSFFMGLEGLMQLFMFAWLIAGSVWVYNLYGNVQHTDPAVDHFCDKTTFWYTFITITISYCFAGLAIMLSVLICCCGCCN